MNERLAPVKVSLGDPLSSQRLDAFKRFIDAEYDESRRHKLEPRLVPWLKILSAEEWRLAAQHIWLHSLSPVEVELKRLCSELVRMDEASGGLAITAW